MKYHYIQVTINTKYKPSYFIGSMIRGAMGHALKKVTCINPSYRCDGCFASSSCLYYKFYEQKNIFHKYRFEIELGSDRFDFGLYLFDDACDGLPYVLSALHMAITQNGLTKNSYKFNDIDIKLNGQIIYNENGFSSIDILQNSFQMDSYCPDIKIKLLTPLRIKKDNKLLTNSVDIEDILRSIYQREQEFVTGERVFKLNYTPTYRSVLKALYYKPLFRKNGKANKRMKMDGLIGEMAIMELDKESYRLLRLGEIIGVGKQTVMGLGQIEVEYI